jgi:hypothetical protein
MAKRIKRILIIGDSFAAEYPDSDLGWSNLLSGAFEVTNLAQAGVSEYKIFKQLQTADLNLFDLVIACHTSPYRVHTKQHPVHRTQLHKNCDLILADIDAHNSFFNPSLRAAKAWFKYHSDDQYLEDTYKLYRQTIENIITFSLPCLNIDNLKSSLPFSSELWKLDLTDFWEEHRGNINHYTIQGNQLLCAMIIKEIEKYESLYHNR